MRLLLDTHALPWWLADDDRPGPWARELIGNPGNNVLISVVLLWEIVVKTRVGKLKADIGGFTDAVRRGGFVLPDIRAAYLLMLAGLTTHHRDPFDHLLIAQAMVEDATLISGDGVIPRYRVRHVSCSAAPPPPLPGPSWAGRREARESGPHRVGDHVGPNPRVRGPRYGPMPGSTVSPARIPAIFPTTGQPGRSAGFSDGRIRPRRACLSGMVVRRGRVFAGSPRSPPSRQEAKASIRRCSRHRRAPPGDR